MPLNKNQEHIDQLRNIIYKALDPLIDDNYVLLDVPNYNNIGDTLIWQGELDYLSRLPYKKLYECSNTFFNEKLVSKNSIILLQGGGNFGDLYEDFSRFRQRIIAKFKENRVIIFPQTVFYKGEKVLAEDIRIYSEHPNLIICARDIPSYNFLIKNFTRNKILLLPDMAFCSDYTKWISNNDHSSKKVLFIERTDKELFIQNQDILNQITSKFPDFEVIQSDWPPIQKEYLKSLMEGNNVSKKTNKGPYKRLRSYVYRILTKPNPVYHRRDFPFCRERNTVKERMCYINEGVDFINSAEVIVTTRLHGLILSIMLDKEVYLLDNSYGKNMNFYEAWLKNFGAVYLLGK